jgi:hypothetical protein
MADKTALQQLWVLEQIAVQRKMQDAELHWPSLLDDKANRGALNDFNGALKLPDEGQRDEALKKVDSQLPADMLTRKVYEQMLADVTAKQIVSQQDLLNLADQRALSIKQFLVESGGLNDSRIQLLKSRS